MSYYDLLLKYKDLPLENILKSISSREALRAIHSEAQDPERLLALLSPAAETYLEQMAQKAHALTLRHFGRTIQLYTPMYLSNVCENECAYCGFSARHTIARRTLTLPEVEKEAAFIAATGIEHLLILTGDSRAACPLTYIRECLELLKKYFSSVSIEIYALSKEEYAELVRAGIDGLTLYQETYDEKVYDRVHGPGPKKDFRFRLDAPERAARSGMRGVNIGALLGLAAWRKDVFLAGLHAQYLQDRYGEIEIGASLPRLRPHTGGFRGFYPVTDKNIAQIITALRLFLPRLGIALSTRESAILREHLLPLGITRMSAGSTTRVGGHTIQAPEEDNAPQFEISDPRDVEAMKTMLAAKGYQPVLKDWMQLDEGRLQAGSYSKTWRRPQLARIEKTKIGIAGAGGLGSNCAACLTRAGFASFTIADFDVLEGGNLDRQFYFEDQIGMKKVEALRENLLRINTRLELRMFAVRLDPENLLEIFGSCDVVVECLDRAEAKSMLVSGLRPRVKLIVSASGLGGYGSNDRLRVRQLKPNLVLIGDLTSDTEKSPALAPRVGMVAAMQADAVLEHILSRQTGD